MTKYNLRIISRTTMDFPARFCTCPSSKVIQRKIPTEVISWTSFLPKNSCLTILVRFKFTLIAPPGGISRNKFVLRLSTL